VEANISEEPASSILRVEVSLRANVVRSDMGHEKSTYI
jgi:hypothetical protein